MTAQTTLEDKARKIGEDCLHVGNVLAAKSERVGRRVVVMRIINVAVSMTVFVSLIPEFRAQIGTTGVSVVSLLAGVVLLLDTVLPLFVGKDGPERFEDYARYILGYKDYLDEALIDAALTDDTRRIRLQETLVLAQLNLRDVRAKWPQLARSALGE